MAVCVSGSIPVVSASWTDSLCLAGSIEEEDLCVQALDLDLMLLAWLEVERGDSLELVFLRHCDLWCGREEANGLGLCCRRRIAQRRGESGWEELSVAGR